MDFKYLQLRFKVRDSLQVNRIWPPTNTQIQIQSHLSLSNQVFLSTRFLSTLYFMIGVEMRYCLYFFKKFFLFMTSFGTKWLLLLCCKSNKRIVITKDFLPRLLTTVPSSFYTFYVGSTCHSQ